MRTAFGTEYRDLRRLAAELEANASTQYLLNRASEIQATAHGMAKRDLIHRPYALSMLLMARAFRSIARERMNARRRVA